jgi:outer membrane protein assembly factor BamA
VFPEFFLGRVHHRALLDANVDDLRTKVQLLGGGNGLRGFAPESLSGSSVLLLNTELRTKPFVFKTFHVGGALFWDAGAAFTGRPRLFHSIGAGLRLHFPQFNTEPIRIDFGYVVRGEPPAVWTDRISSSFGQITDTQTEFFQQ